MQPGPERVPTTPLLTYFRSALFKGPRGKDWGAHRREAASKWIDDASQLAQLFEDSVALVEHEYQNYQPFYPARHTFGVWADKKIPHGERLRGTVDVAARLSKREVWPVATNSQLDFRYLDREIAITRSKPKPLQDPGVTLEVDLFLANAYDRTPILGEVKVKKDQCPFYALIQLLTQAAYAVTPSQRARLALFGSRPDFVLLEAVPGKPSFLDLYVFLVEPPVEYPYKELREAAIELSLKLIADTRVASRIGRIAWIEGAASGSGLALEAIKVAPSLLRLPNRTPIPPLRTS